MKIVIWILAIIVALVVIGWIGLRVKPAPFDSLSLPSSTATPATMPLPQGLPAPVDRFYRQVYGDEVPVVKTAVITGRASMRIAGITFPARFRFTHDAGNGYRHYIEATFLGLPLMKVNEHFLNGIGRMELPIGVEEGPTINQGANLALWGEAIWFPTLWVTDPRARWEPVDAVTALLFVPFADEEEQFVVRFDPETGRPFLLEAMRYKGTQAVGKTLWLSEALAWGVINDHPTFATGAVTWFDEGTPWAIFTAESLVTNVDVSAYIQAKGE